VGNIENKRSTTNRIQRRIRHTIRKTTTGGFPFRGIWKAHQRVIPGVLVKRDNGWGISSHLQSQCAKGVPFRKQLSRSAEFVLGLDGVNDLL
jgi:hypothetical protein